MAGEFIPGGNSGGNCGEVDANWARPSPSYHYIFKGNADPASYPDDACEPWYHETAQIDGLKLNTPGITGAGSVIVTGEVSAQGITLTSRKPFDIPHPTKKGHRLRHVCLEGPESGVYFRGRLTGKNIIDLPDYWQGLVDPETITVSLTQIGSSQDLIVEKVEWGKRVRIKSGSGTTIDCYYLIHAERADGEKLIVEYEGKSPDDYPGDNSIYSINK
jgi:hypothetical protein